MLPIERISHTITHSEDWLKQRLGKITASKFGVIIGEKSDKGIFTSGAITHLENLAGEIDTGQPSQDEFFTKDTDWGNAHEPEAIQYFAKQLNLNVVKNSRGDSQHLIVLNEKAGATPDALLTKHNEENIFDETGTKMKVFTLETKCPPKHHRYIKLFKCKTPQDLKKTESIYYWQVIFQMLCCDTIVGYFGAYNPNFSIKGRLIEFKKIDLIDDFKKAKLTLDFACKEIDNILNLFKN